MTLKELREKAKSLGIKGYSRLTKSELYGQIKAVETPETFKEYVENLFPTPPATPPLYFEGNDRVAQGFAKVRKGLRATGNKARRYFDHARRLLFVDTLSLLVCLQGHDEALRASKAIARACQYSLLALEKRAEAA